MPRKFVVTDIHGCAGTFRKLVLEVLQLQKADQLYLLGDYIDRGIDSKAVFDFIFDLNDKGFNVHCLRGNHEEFLLEAKHNIKAFQHWVTNNGGDTTLRSFGADTVNQIPDKYYDFINELPYYLEVDRFLLVHAGFNFLSHHPFDDKEAMVSIRDFAIDYDFLDGRKIIHGHTPTRLAQIVSNVENQDAAEFNLDAGCVYQNVPDLHNMVALELNQWKLYSTSCIDEIPESGR